MGLLLQDMDSMVSTTMDIEREIDGAWSIQDTGASEKREEDQPSSSSRKKQRTSIPRGRPVQGCGYQGQGQGRGVSKSGPIICYHSQQLGDVRQNCP